MSLERVKHLDLYKLLCIDRNSDQKSIKRSYRILSRSCHPDKNLDKNTVDLFHQLSDALEVLTVENYKSEYDKIWDAKKVKKERDDNLDRQRRQFKKNLEEREACNCSEAHDEEERRQETIDKLREEARILLEKEQEDVLKKLENLFISRPKGDPILKIKWSKGNEPLYTKESIGTIFDKYGKVENIVLKGRSALIEFENIAAAKMAYNTERGFSGNPLIIKPLFEDTESKYIFTKYPCMKSKSSVNDSISEMEELVFSKLLKYNIQVYCCFTCSSYRSHNKRC